MESSRGGPLTTFIMMLPLIVVPAIAMLKPTDLKDGWVSSLLSAADSSDETADSAGSAPEFGDGVDEFAALFGEESEPESSGFSEVSDDLDDDLFREASGSLVSEQSSLSRNPGATLSAAPRSGSSNVGNAELAPLMTKLEGLGAVKTLWFTPRPQMVGFAAFFRPDGGMLSYRFAAIAQTRAAAVQDVMQQVLDWKRNPGR